MLSLSDRIMICHRCPHRQKACAGACACTIDGADIIAHAESGQCPENRFAEPPISPVKTFPLAGDIVEAMAQKIGADKAAAWLAKLAKKPDCGCKARKEKLNKMDQRLRKLLGLAADANFSAI